MNYPPRHPGDYVKLAEVTEHGKVRAAIKSMAADNHLGRAPALRRSMLALIDNGKPYASHPVLLGAVRGCRARRFGRCWSPASIPEQMTMQSRSAAFRTPAPVLREASALGRRPKTVT